MPLGQIRVRDRHRLNSLSSGSAMAVCLALAAPAWADCAPDPAPAGGTIVCTGSDPDGLTVATNGTIVTIGAAATVATLTATTAGSAGPITPDQNAITINQAGRISGGLTIQTGARNPDNYYAPSTTVTLTLADTGILEGSTGVTLTSGGTGPFGGGIASATITNSGIIRSTNGGLAIRSTNPNGGIARLTNEASGQIGSIVSLVTSLDNRGRIDGGTASAISFGTLLGSNGLLTVPPDSWKNSGTIVSGGAAPTLDLQNGTFGGPGIVNSGAITNTGQGAAIRFSPAERYVTSGITNEAGGTIASAGGTAITAGGALILRNAGRISATGTSVNVSGWLQLTNTGTINGSVVAGGEGLDSGTIDLSGGMITGNLTLGNGNDVVIASLVPGASLVAGLGGSLDAGGGFDRIVYQLIGDTTLSAAPVLPATIEGLGFRLAADKTATFTDTVDSTVPLQLTVGRTDTFQGSATFVNKGKITTAGPAIDAASDLGTIVIENSGTITASLTSPYQFAVTTGSGRFTNTGTITAAGGGGLSSFGEVINSGRITASGAGVQQRGNGFSNSGVITSTTGSGVALSGSFGDKASNTGTITGATAGATLGGLTFTNSGTIGSEGGFGVAIDSGATLINQRGGVINGGIGPGVFGFVLSANINNAGTINGNVALGSPYPVTTGNMFIAQDGGVVNGNLALGDGDRFVTSVANSGPGRYAGVTGTVTAGAGATLIYRVDSDVTAALALPDGVFSEISYDLANAAKLTLTPSARTGSPQTFSGTGEVALNANLSGTGLRPVIDLTRQSPRASTSNAISLTSSGTIDATMSQLGYTSGFVALLTTGNSFTNAGTITANNVLDLPSYYSPAAAITSFSGTVTNTGTLTVGGAAAVRNEYSSLFLANAPRAKVINSGTIVQLAGAADATGVTGTFDLTNSGTIATGGNAVVIDGTFGNAGSVVNSGTISSQRGVAVSSNVLLYGSSPIGGLSVVNRAGGRISGGTGQPAISLASGVVDNAGSITGDVNLGGSLPSYASGAGYGSTYIARGGTLNGNLSFGRGNDLLLVIDGPLGVTGTVDGGDGVDTFAQVYTSSTTVEATKLARPANFEVNAIGTSGNGTRVTVTGPAEDLSKPVGFFGNGAIVNQANVAAAAAGRPLNTVQLGQFNDLLGLSGGLDFSNSAVLGDGVAGSARRFANSGTIASSKVAGTAAVRLQDIPGASFDFTNSGAITGNGVLPASQNNFTAAIAISLTQTGQTIAPKTTITNSGTISGGWLAANIRADRFEFTNSGSISGDPWSQIAILLNSAASDGVKPTSAGSTASFANQAAGRIDGSVYLTATSTSVDFANAGQIKGSSSVSGSATNVTAANSGTITTSLSGATGLAVIRDAAMPGTPAGTGPNVTITNSGSISSSGGGAFYSCCYFQPGANTPIPVLQVSTGLMADVRGSDAPGLTITNAAGGTISATGATAGIANTIAPPQLGSVGNIGLVAFAERITITNAGTISGGSDLTTPLDVYSTVGAERGLDPTFAGGVQVYANKATLTNSASGIINGSVGLTTLIQGGLTNYGQIRGNVYLGASDDSFVQGLGATLTGTADGGAGNDTLTIDLTGGGALDSQLSHFTGFETTRLTGAGTITATTPLSAGTLMIDGVALTVAAGSTLQTAGPVTLTGSGTNTVVNYGTIAGRVELGAGNDSFVQGIAGRTGAVDGGTGANSLTIDITGGGNLSTAAAPFSNFAGLTLTGAGTVSLTGALAAPTVTLNGSALTLASGSTLQSAGSVTLTGGSGTNSFTNRGTVLGAIVDVETENGAGGRVVVATTATSRAGFTNSADATLAIDAGTFTLGRRLVNGGLVAVAQGAKLVDLAGITNLAGGRITIAQGGTIVDALDNAGTVVNGGTYTADLNNLAGGSVTNSAGATWTGAIGNAAGATLVNQGAVVGSLTNAGDFTNAAGASLSGMLTQSGGTTTNAGTLAAGAVVNGGSLVSSGTINGLNNAGTVSITGGNLAGAVTNSGTLTIAAGTTISGQITNRGAGRLAGTIAFGAGNDTLTLANGTGATVAIDGGAGTDTLVIASAGTDALPDEYNLTRITGFERTTLTSGTIAVSGSYATGQFDVLAGRYIGRAGSTLTAPRITVGAGTSFGSGGTVIGDVTVNGTLAPGGTTGPMTVTGNVSFASGSLAAYDVGQTGSDQLLVSGQVTIAAGTTLTLTEIPGNALKPGSGVDLLVANGGITGSFTTINKPASILGFVVQRANRISLLGQFLAEPGFGVPATAAITYVNSVLVGGQASAGLLAALPSLLTTSGGTSAEAFARLTPEAYATASQIGTDNGLSIAGALRTLTVDRAAAPGKPFVFAQALGRTSQLAGNAALGTARANETGGGVLGGIGVSAGPVTLAGFVGTLGNRQTITALSARTTANGTLVGGSATFATGRVSGGATIAYDLSNAETSRTGPSGTRETARYRLRSTVMDARLGYDLPIGSTLQLHSQAGYTRIRTVRGTASETGSAGAFDLVVATGRNVASFIDASTRLEPGPASKATIRPWAELGVRHLLDADIRLATGSLPGGPAGFTVAGVGRSRTVATVGLGLNAAVGSHVTLFGSYDGAFGTGNTTNRGNIGVRMAF